MLDDVHQTFRFLRREPLLAAAMLTTLALAIGSTTAIFSVLDAVIIRPLPFTNPEELVVVWQQDRTSGAWFTVSPANFLDLQKQTAVFDSLAAVQQFQETDFNLTSGAAPETVKGIRVSPELFRVLGVRPSIGRPFTAADSESGSARVVVLAHDLSTARFGADPRAVGTSIRLNGEVATVIGIMPPAFEVPNEVVHAQLLLPITWNAAQRQERSVANYFVIGRLNRGVGIAKASDDLDRVARRLEREYPVDNKDTGVLVQPLREQMVGTVRPALLIVFAAAASVLALACFNLANLLTARGITRRRELAVRAALGATRLRLLQQTLTEGLVIAFLGGAAGLALGMWTVRAFVALFNDTRYFSLPRRAEIAIDWRVFAFVSILSIATALLFSLAPAVRAMNTDPAPSMRRADSRSERRWRGVLMSGELAIALMLVVACVQLVRSYTRLQNQERGFQSDDRLSARIALPAARYPTPAGRAAFFRRLLAQAAEIPDAAGAAAVQLLPLNGVGSLRSVARTDRAADTLPSAFHFVVTPGYFETMGIPRLAGRTFTAEDSAERSRVVILSQSASQRYFPNEDPIGRMLRIRDSANGEWQIVGIVGDVRNQRLDRVPQPQIYVPMDQSPAAVMTIVVRSRTHDPLALARALREKVRAIDVEQGVADIKPMTQVVDDSAARWRVSTDLFLGFGAVALLLALIGLHSMIAFNVAQRSREIAIRIALGGSRRAIVALLLRSMYALCVSGLAAGLLLSAALARGLSSLLYAVTPVDPIAFGAASIAFLAAAAAAGGWTAYRTTNIHPLALLRADS